MVDNDVDISSKFYSCVCAIDVRVCLNGTEWADEIADQRYFEKEHSNCDIEVRGDNFDVTNFTYFDRRCYKRSWIERLKKGKIKWIL